MGPFETNKTAKDYLLGTAETNQESANGQQPSGTVNDKVAFGYKEPGTADRLIPKSLRAEQIAKAGIFAGTSLGELGLINKIKKTQLGRSMLMLNPVQTTVQPSQDMPAEVLNERQNQIARIRSQYAGSDPSSKLVADQMAAAQRAGATDQLSAERAKLLIDERRRVASETAANQVRMGEGYNQNIDRQQALNDYKLESRVNADEHKKKLLSQVGTQLTDNLETAQAYGTQVGLVNKQNKLGILQSQYNQKAEELSRALHKGSYNDQKVIRAEMDALMKNYNAFVDQDHAGTYWTKPTYFKNGGKLIPRI